jgi:mannose-6-phosphate isomerase
LREAISDGSIQELIAWRIVLPGDVLAVPAGTIHAIGAGLVIAEIQQRSDATFRMFDFGRKRELHVADATAVALGELEKDEQKSFQASDERTVLVSNAYFAFERIELAANKSTRLHLERETWLLLVNGSGRTGFFDVTTGDAIFAQSDDVNIQAGPKGMTYLTASANDGEIDAQTRYVREQDGSAPLEHQ